MRTSATDGILGAYQFLLVFENANAHNYVTEKLWRAYRLGVVPVYMGAPNVLRAFAPQSNAVIRVTDHASPKVCARTPLARARQFTMS